MYDKVMVSLTNLFLAIFIWYLLTEILSKIGLLPAKSK